MARLTKDDIDKFYEYDIDFSARTITAFGDIDEVISERVAKALHILDRSEGPITIKMCTDGGEWYCGMAIFDAITACSNEVTVVGIGKIMSMGAIILQAADRRVLTPNCTVMVHYGSDWFGGHAKDLERRADESRRSSAVMEDIFLAQIRVKHPKYTREGFKAKFAFDVFMSALDAVAFGLADEILT